MQSMLLPRARKVLRAGLPQSSSKCCVAFFTTPHNFVYVLTFILQNDRFCRCVSCILSLFTSRYPFLSSSSPMASFLSPSDKSIPHRGSRWPCIYNMCVQSNPDNSALCHWCSLMSLIYGNHLCRLLGQYINIVLLVLEPNLESSQPHFLWG